MAATVHIERPFRGWHMVVAAHVLFGLCFGAMYAFGVFFEHIQRSFDAGRFSVSAIFSATAFVYSWVGLFAGVWADRYAIRHIVGTGVALLALGFLAASWSDSVVGLLLVYGLLVGVGIGLVYVPAITVVQRWFVRGRSRATGWALAGTGIGTFLGPVAAGFLLQDLSWRSTMQWFAAVIVVLGWLAAWVLVNEPSHIGQTPDGEAPAAHPSAAGATGQTLSQAMGTARFWWMFAAIFLASIGLFVALVHLNPFARALGVSATQGPVLIGLIGVGNVMGRLLLGGLGDRWGPMPLLLGLNLALALLPVWWWWADGFGALAVFALLFGAAHGGCISLYPSAAANLFGTRHLGAVLGALYVSVGFAALVGGSAAGWLFDVTQTYGLSIVGCAVAALLAVGCLAAARKRV